MDPLSAIGLAGTIVQFIDFSRKILVGGAELYKSADGVIDLNKQVELATQDLTNFTIKLQRSPQTQNGSAIPTEDELALSKLCFDCNVVAEQLLERLGKLKLNTEVSSQVNPLDEPQEMSWKKNFHERKEKITKVRQSIKVVLLNVWGRGEMEELAARLEKYRAAIQARLLGSLLEHVQLLSVQQSQRFDRLDGETKRIAGILLDDIRANLSKDIRQQTEALAQLINQQEIVVTDKRNRDKRVVVDMNMEENKDQAYLVEEARQHERSVRELADNEILSSLDFEAQTERYEALSEAHERTFEWIFQSSHEEEVQWDSFGDWLESEDGLYWIQGKAGSGKSTLMKYICHNPATERKLSIWAKGKALCMASFYFWALGPHPLQKSQIGLLRALLRQILGQVRDLISAVFPEQWAAMYTSMSLSNNSKVAPWTLPALSKGWNSLVKLINDEQRQSKMAIFVDGLDEFEGLHADMAKLFGAAVASPHVKVCVSSRPERAYEKAFGNRPSLRLQDLTYNDIRNYVEDRLVKDENMQHLFEREREQAGQLVAEVVTSANGVFLWVYLVVTSLLKGLGNDDGISDLQRELRRLPKTLKDLYIHMIIPNGEIHYKEEAISFFQLVNSTQFLDGDLRIPSPMTILGMCLAMQPEKELSAMSQRFIADISTMVSVFQDMSRRLKSRTGGLLEVQFRGARAGNNLSPYMPVGYLHRTVQEFLVTPEMRVFLQEETEFDPDYAMFKSSIYELQIMDPDQDGLWFSALTYARRNQARGHASQTALLDHLHTISPQRKYVGLEPEMGAKYIGGTNGMLVYQGSNVYECFLFTAVEFDLHLYLRDKLTTNSQYPTSIAKRNLLRHALTMGYNTSPETVLTLLSCGRNPFDPEPASRSASRTSKVALERERSGILHAVIRYLKKTYPCPSGISYGHERELTVWADVFEVLLHRSFREKRASLSYDDYEEAVSRLYTPHPDLQKRLLSLVADDTSERSIRRSCLAQ